MSAAPGLAGEALITALLEHGREIPESAISEAGRRLLHAVLMRDEEELSTELVRGAVEALRRHRLERAQRELKHRIAEAERRHELSALPALLQEKVKVDRELAGISQAER